MQSYIYIFLFILCVIVLLVLFFALKKKPDKNLKIDKNLQYYLQIISNQNTKVCELEEAIVHVSEKFYFTKQSEDYAIFMKFIQTIILHKNTNAKLIVKMNTLFKQKNKTLQNEIDLCEQKILNKI